MITGLAGIDDEPAVVTTFAVHAVVLGSALLFGLPAALRYWLKRQKRRFRQILNDKNIINQ